MEESIKIPRIPFEFKPGDVWNGLVCSTESRLALYCRLTIFNTDLNYVKGNFEISNEFGISACCPLREPNPFYWHKSTFTARVNRNTSDDDGNIILHDFQTPLNHHLIPAEPLSLIQQGPIMTALYSTPTPCCFYLINKKI